MPAKARREVFDETECGAYHCYSRCVRGLFQLENRRPWIYGRLEALAGVFAVDVLEYAVMFNHLHVILRNRPDVVRRWSDREVVRRWLRLSSKSLELAEEPSEEQIEAVLKDPKKVATYRRRLSHISWFMKMLKEPVSRQANQEDNVHGHFWESRYKCQRLLDEVALLVCMIYVGLNPIRALLAPLLEASEYTGIYDRIRDHRAALRQELAEPYAGWLAPISLDGDGYAGAAARRRASDKGILSLSREEYLLLADLTSRELRPDKRGAVSAELAPILERIGVRSDKWMDTILNFKRFGSAVGKAAELTRRAAAAGQRWFKGIAHCRAAFIQA